MIRCRSAFVLGPYHPERLLQCRKNWNVRRWHTDHHKRDAKNATALMGFKAMSVGTMAGLCGALTGTGGGFVMIPLMTSMLKIPQHQAHGNSLFAVAATGFAGALGYGLAVVEMDSASIVAICGMMTARLGAIVTSKLSSCHLQKYLGLFMIAMAPMIHLKSHLKKQQEQATNAATTTAMTATSSLESPQQNYIPIIMIGLGSGFLSGLLGIGGGTIVVPALVLGTDMSYHSALGTSLFAMSFPAMVGTYTHFQKKNLCLRVASPLAMGCFVGAYLGGNLSVQLDESLLKNGFSGVMLTLGLKSFLRL